ncbi:hypothetical protein SDC9_137412 [bioreactor metagenome]|uniref:Uncharacterized protein n=1 Tax=bioreactor metagenome TaxID=1076179 RepID=A0A645DM22_9ZZZZ
MHRVRFFEFLGEKLNQQPQAITKKDGLHPNRMKPVFFLEYFHDNGQNNWIAFRFLKNIAT